ncbi:MAG: secretin N-terminal domain-containing protein, partial [Betaproteobacteria bacterium]|nr:secretin N-terminal domain-containing protein [Betaproteobacteria bacterium]
PGVAGAATPQAAAPTGQGASSLPGVTDSSRIQTQTRNDFWDELEKTLRAIVGAEPGRSVVVNAQAGVVVVRALPSELRAVDTYLRAIRASVERQVVLEAKIIEVTLNSQYQTGINWAAFAAGQRLSAGPVSPGTVLQRQTSPTGETLVTGPGTAVTRDPTSSSLTFANPGLGADVGSNLINFNVPGASLFGLAFQTRNFAALLSFLESQGAVQVLSSPRIATINNQKAVLKVGTDQFFLTNISGSNTTTTTTAAGTALPSFPTITLRPFFSGVALDITPQINEESEIILHIHPSVSDVQTDNRQVDLGAAFGGQISLPVAKSNVSETDSIVRVGDGNIVAIGGLMKVDVENTKSGLPGTQNGPLEPLFNSTNRTIVKKELVILIKPTVVQSGEETAAETRQARERILNMMQPASAAERR